MRRVHLAILFTLLVAAGVGLGLLSNPARQILSPPPPKTTQAQKFSDGTITVPIPPGYGLAVTPEQILAHAYIPPCNENFNYCLYYYASAYAGTNFETAGIRIKKRTDLATSDQCLRAPPEGYADLAPRIVAKPDYSTSAFSPLGNGAAGHYATGALYRLNYKNTCYEFETRVGKSQFANSPPGTIKEFTAGDEARTLNSLNAHVGSITLPGSEQIIFPF